MALATKLEEKFSYEQYLTWPDDERWEIIEGIPYNMSPAPKRKHQKILGNLYFTIRKQINDKKCEVYVAPFDVRLPKNKNDSNGKIYTVVQPDIVIYCDTKKLDDAGAIGAPEVVIEILSPSTAKKDFTVKLDLYEKHEVKEYILIHPEDKLVYIYTLKNKKYGKATIIGEEDVLNFSQFPQLNIELEKVFSNE